MPGTITIDGVTYTAIDAPAAASAPAAPAAASPFAAVGLSTAAAASAASDTRPAEIRDAWNAAPQGEAAKWAREAARLHRVPGFACDVAVTVHTRDGDTIISAHGFAYAKSSGAACTGNGCAGKVL